MPDEVVETPGEDEAGGFRFIEPDETPDLGLQRDRTLEVQRFTLQRLDADGQPVVGGEYESALGHETVGEVRLANGEVRQFPYNGVPFPRIEYQPTTFTYTVSASSITPNLMTQNYITYSATANTLYMNNGPWWTERRPVFTDEDVYRAGTRQNPVLDEDANLARLAQVERDAEERHNRARRAAHERQRGINRARELLMAHLDEEQKAFYEQQQYFDIIGSLGTKFRIGRGTSGNVQVITPDGRIYANICAHPAGNLPEPDVHLAQMLALMCDEEGFVSRANVHAGRMVRYVDTDEGVRRAMFAPSAAGPSVANTVVMAA